MLPKICGMSCTSHASCVVYPSDLSEAEWRLLEPLLLPPPKRTNTGGRPRRWSLRRLVNGIFYVLKSGCPWRMLPLEYPPWKTVYGYFRRWRIGSTWEKINDALRERLRAALGREPSPSAAVMDSQSVKTTEKGGPRGIDGHKKVKGRKRHLLTDTQGLVLAVAVTPANVADSTGAFFLLEGLTQEKLAALPRMAVLFADQAYRGQLEDWVKEALGWRLEIVKGKSLAERKARVWEIARERARNGASVPEIWAGLSFNRFEEVIPKRWVIERTFAWLGKYRRLAKDWEALPETVAAMIFLAMTRLMLKRLARLKAGKPPRPFRHYR